MIETIGIFILFLCPLVFVHELGHFLFCRLFNVQVEVFSIGFGPKLFKFKKGGTEYALSLIPLGGYVKMFGDDPLTKDEIPEEDRKKSFTFQGKWARFWIVFGGPLLNFVFAFVLFFFLALSGERLPEIRFGVIEQKTMFYDLGLRTGDVLKRVNGLEIFSPTDIPIEGKGFIDTVTVKRSDQMRKLSIQMKVQDFFENFSKHPPLLRKPFVLNKRGEKFIVSFNRDKVELNFSLDQMMMQSGMNKIYLFKLPLEEKRDLIVASEGLSKLYVKELDISFNSSKEFIDELERLELMPIDLLVKNVTSDSPAGKSGIKRNDVIVALDGERVDSFLEVRNKLQKIKDLSANLTLWREGEVINVKVTPEEKKQNGEKVKLIGVYSGIEYIKLNFIHTASKGFFGSIHAGIAKTWLTIVKTIDGIKKLITNEVSIKNIGGPIAIGKVAADSFNTSLSYFFQIMALISVNLGLINLFPIPVLDGGHIMFIGLEIMNRGPLSRRKMEVAQQFGLSLLLLLMFAALYNDFSRYFQIF